MTRRALPDQDPGKPDHVPACDMPDIIDMVMEMGRHAVPTQTGAESKAQAEADAPALSPFHVPSAAGGPAQMPPPLPRLEPHEPNDAPTRLPGHLSGLAGRARDYADAASSANTRRAYSSDWKHFASWCRRQGLDPLPPDPRVVGLYVTACASGTAGGQKANAVSTIERRLSSLAWNYAQRGLSLDRKDRHVATVMAGIRNRHAAPPRQKEAILPDDLRAMLETLDRGTLRGLRDRAILLIGFAGGLRRSEIVGLDCGRDQSEDGRGWVDLLDEGIIVTLRGKTGWREVEIGRGSSDATCPLIALRNWMSLARIANGPLFRRISAGAGAGRSVAAERLDDRHVARLVKRTALAAGIRGELGEAEREKLFSGHSLRAGLASSAEVEERYVQKQLGHASAEMTRKYQRRRDRFRVNLTKASGL